MRIRWQSLSAVLLALASVSTAAKERISILDFTRVGPGAQKSVTAEDASYLTQQVRDAATTLLDASRFEIMTRENILVMLPPGKKDLSECEGQCEVETARNLASRWHVVGDVRKVGTQLALSVRLYDVVGGTQLGGIRVMGPSVDVLVNGLEPKGKELFSKIPGLTMPQSASVPAVNSPPPVVVASAPAPSTKGGGSGSPKSGMVAIPAGCFQMGSNDGEADEMPVREVCLKGFSIDKFEVTNAAYSRSGRRMHYDDDSCKAFGLSTGGKWLKGRVPDQFRGSSHPVVCVNWSEAKSYCESEGKRLPTEAEYEYATRAGTSTRYSWGMDAIENCRNANGADQTPLSDGNIWNAQMRVQCKDGYGDMTSPVGSFQPNPWGLYDMSGNVWAWTSDWYDKAAYESLPQSNPTGPDSGSHRVTRGGGWSCDPKLLRSASRGHSAPGRRDNSLGFRCVSP